MHLYQETLGLLPMMAYPSPPPTTQVITTNKIMGLPLDVNAESSWDSLFFSVVAAYDFGGWPKPLCQPETLP
jgi:hypothetical protein